LAGFSAFPCSRARTSRTVAAATCSTGRRNSANMHLFRPRRISLSPRRTVSSAFATPSGQTPSTDLRSSPGLILNASASRQRQHGYQRKRGNRDAGTFNLGDDDAGICRGGPCCGTPPIVTPRLTPRAGWGRAHIDRFASTLPVRGHARPIIPPSASSHVRRPSAPAIQDFASVFTQARLLCVVLMVQTRC